MRFSPLEAGRRAVLMGMALALAAEAAAPDFSDLLAKLRSTSFQGRTETFGLNITTWQMPHGGFSKGSVDWYNAPWDGKAARSVTLGQNDVELGMFDNTPPADGPRCAPAGGPGPSPIPTWPPSTTMP